MKLQIQCLVGFVDGEECFHVFLNGNREMKCGVQTVPEFTVTQHQRDISLLYALKACFGCGVVRVNNGKRFCSRVPRQKDFLEIICPFFEKHKLKSKKRVEFEKFRQVVLLMAKRKHLTGAGVDKIRKIAQTMNRKGHSIDET